MSCVSLGDMGLWVSASLQEATPVTVLFLSVLSPSNGPTEHPGDPTHGQPAGGHMGPATPREPEWEHPRLQGKLSCVGGLFFQLTVPRGPEGFDCTLAAHWTAVSPQHMHSMDAGPSAWSRLGGDSIREKSCSEKSHTGSGRLCAQPQRSTKEPDLFRGTC